MRKSGVFSRINVFTNYRITALHTLGLSQGAFHDHLAQTDGILNLLQAESVLDSDQKEHQLGGDKMEHQTVDGRCSGNGDIGNPAIKRSDGGNRRNI